MAGGVAARRAPGGRRLEAFVLEFPNVKRCRTPAGVAPVLAEVDAMLERIGPRREEPRELYLREPAGVGDLQVNEA